MPLLYEGKRIGIWRSTGWRLWLQFWIVGLHIYAMPQAQIGPFHIWIKRNHRMLDLDLAACCFRSFLP